MAHHFGFGFTSNLEEMFDPTALSELSDIAPEGMIVRPLERNDYDKGFLGVLGQLTSVGEISREKFIDRFDSMRNTRPKSYYIVVIEDKTSRTIVGAATLVVEWKFIHEAGCRGRVEDVVVDQSKRGLKLGAVLNKVLVYLAKKVGVYKLSLECKDSLIPFYELYGFKKDVGNNFLVQRFDSADIVIIPSSNFLYDMPYNLPSLVTLDHRHLCMDKEWKLHKLPKEGISIPRDEVPDLRELSTIGAIAESQENERPWNDAGLERIYMGPSDQIDDS